MKKHFTREEILRQQKELSELKQTQLSAPHSGMAIMLNYILWEEYGYRLERLSRFNNSVNEYIQKYEDGEIEFEYLQKRLMDKADFMVEYVVEKESDITINKKNKYAYDLAKKQSEINNQITRYCSLYILSSFNVMMDNKFGKVRLEKLRDELTGYLKQVDENKIKTMDIHKTLAKRGVFIELPMKR